MRTRMLRSLLGVLATAGLARAQVPATLPPAPPGGVPAVVGYPLPGVPGPGGHPGHPEGPPPVDEARWRGWGFGPAGEDWGHWGRGHQVYVRTECLLWGLEEPPLPGLAVLRTLPVTLTPAAGTVALGVGNQLPVLIDPDLHYGEHAGGRLTVGGYFHTDCGPAVEVSYFQVERRSASAVVSQFTNVGSLTPVTATLTAGETVTTVVDTLARDMTVHLSVAGSSRFWGLEANCRTGCCDWGYFCLYGLAGLRHLNLAEDLRLGERVTLRALPGSDQALTFPTDPATGLAVPGVLDFLATDHVGTRNGFYGPQLGGSWEWCCGRVFTSIHTKLGVGLMRQEVNLFGTVQEFTTGEQTPGGALVDADDLGEHRRNRCSFLAEVNFNVGYHVTHQLRVFAGYTFLGLTAVARPGDQFNARSSPTVLQTGEVSRAGQQQPAFRFNDSDLLIQGCNFGLEFLY